MYKDLIAKITKDSNVHFVTKPPEGVNPKDVVVLVDPGDASRDRWEGKGFELYLPILYGKKSFLLAMELSIKRPKTNEELIKTMAYKFIKGFYKNLLGEKFEDKDVILWFREPWLLKDKIESLTQELKILRIGIRQLDISA